MISRVWQTRRAQHSTGLLWLRRPWAGDAMNSIDAVDELVREYLLFRGFHGTLKQFDVDVKNDAARGFQVDRLLEHLLALLQGYELQAMLDFWYYLDSRFFSRLEQSFLKAVKRFELDLLRLYLVNAVQHARKDKVQEFFELYSTELANSPEWSSWFGASTRSRHAHIAHMRMR